MKENTSKYLDSKDKQILLELDKNARITYSQLAKRVKVSKQVARYRVERLEKQEYIKGYYSIIDTSLLGYITFRVYLKWRSITPKLKKDILSWLHQQPSIWAIVNITGKWNLALGISVKNIHQFHEVWESILTNHLENIDQYDISIYSPIYHFTKSYLTGKRDKNPYRILGSKTEIIIDDMDLKILNLLAKNARMSLVNIAISLDISAELVSFRKKQLEKKGVIQGYRAMINVEKLGYHFFKCEIRLLRYKNIKKILAFCHEHPNIYQVNKVIGGETLEIEFHVLSLNDMITILEQMEETFPNTIEKYEYITILGEEKMVYLPMK